MSEPKVVYATLRDSVARPGIDIECRFDDGQKFAAVSVDEEFPLLAARIAMFLSGELP